VSELRVFEVLGEFAGMAVLAESPEQAVELAKADRTYPGRFERAWVADEDGSSLPSGPAVLGAWAE
jgi:hypothetical protein